MNPVQKTWYKGFSLIVGLAFVLVLASPAAAQKNSTNEIEPAKTEPKRLLSESDQEETEEIPKIIKFFSEKASLRHALELRYEYADVSDVEDRDSGSASDLFLETYEVALEVVFNDWARFGIAVNAEDFFAKDSKAKISLAEAFLALECPWFPLYFTGSKMPLPFGVFENRMISDTLTEELYEIDTLGATFGVAPDWFGLDISFTVYRGQNVIENLEDFGTHEFRSGRENVNRISSYIVNVVAEPVEDALIMSGFYDSEPGDGRRNQSIGGALTWNVWEFVFDAAYIAALQREAGEDGEENLEGAWLAALAFCPLDRLELAFRYEDFDDDREGGQDGILDYSFLAGFNYALFDHGIFSFEYRFSAYEKERGSNAEDSQNEVNLRLTIEF